MTRLAVLGTGIIGGAMARRCADHGFDVTSSNRDRAKAERLGDAGATIVDTPFDVIADAAEQGLAAPASSASDGPETSGSRR